MCLGFKFKLFIKLVVMVNVWLILWIILIMCEKLVVYEKDKVLGKVCMKL